MCARPNMEISRLSLMNLASLASLNVRQAADLDYYMATITKYNQQLKFLLLQIMILELYIQLPRYIHVRVHMYYTVHVLQLYVYCLTGSAPITEPSPMCISYHSYHTTTYSSISQYSTLIYNHTMYMYLHERLVCQTVPRHQRWYIVPVWSRLYCNIWPHLTVM